MNKFKNKQVEGSYIWSDAFNFPSLFVKIRDASTGLFRRATMEEVRGLIEKGIIPEDPKVLEYYDRLRFKMLYLRILTPTGVANRLRSPLNILLKEIKEMEALDKDFPVLEYALKFAGVTNINKGKPIACEKWLQTAFLKMVEEQGIKKGKPLYKRSHFDKIRKDPLGFSVAIKLSGLMVMAELTGYNIMDIYHLLAL